MGKGEDGTTKADPTSTKGEPADPNFRKFLNSFVDYSTHVRHLDHNCGAFKVNCALTRLPDFVCLDGLNNDSEAGPQHRGTIHFENKMEELHHAYREASMGIPASKPIIEMTIPSSLDDTLV